MIIGGNLRLYLASAGTDSTFTSGTTINGTCSAPGEIVFNGTDFLGCVELATGPVTGTWKKLNN